MSGWQVEPCKVCLWCILLFWPRCVMRRKSIVKARLTFIIQCGSPIDGWPGIVNCSVDCPHQPEKLIRYVGYSRVLLRRWGNHRGVCLLTDQKRDRSGLGGVRGALRQVHYGGFSLLLIWLGLLELFFFVGIVAGLEIVVLAVLDGDPRLKRQTACRTMGLEHDALMSCHFVFFINFDLNF